MAARGAKQHEAMQRYGLFEVLGIELEYMLVDRSTLAIRPEVSRILNEGGAPVDELKFQSTAWSNELVSHVLEIKTEPPVVSVDRAYEWLRTDLENLLPDLQKDGYTLMGTGMHPSMRPEETVLWPGENGPIYRTFDRIFDCSGHGWSNLQSMHLNFPFKDDYEFSRLMAAIRVLLPIIPAISASSPICEDRWTGFLDYRLEVYRQNAARVPSVSGQVVPEPVFEPSEYNEKILQRIYDDLEPLDPEGILRDEWVNARGAIARFQRNAIEIRVIDTQETLSMDMAIACMVVEVLRNLVEERWSDFSAQAAASQDLLVDTFQSVLRKGGSADLDASYCSLLGLQAGTAESAWQSLCERMSFSSEMKLDRSVEFLLSRGSLARRIKEPLELSMGTILTSAPVSVRDHIPAIYGQFASPLLPPYSPVS